mmetsp:Transcript_23342/g.45924  ORF Transcript_23342/g.45924 Transcript_23342/m.45924 type:complete len:477 (+) Transcript_23342:151-1581(+)
MLRLLCVASFLFFFVHQCASFRIAPSRGRRSALPQAVRKRSPRWSSHSSVLYQEPEDQETGVEEEVEEEEEEGESFGDFIQEYERPDLKKLGIDLEAYKGVTDPKEIERLDQLIGEEAIEKTGFPRQVRGQWISPFVLDREQYERLAGQKAEKRDLVKARLEAEAERGEEDDDSEMEYEEGDWYEGEGETEGEEGSWDEGEGDTEGEEGNWVEDEEGNAEWVGGEEESDGESAESEEGLRDPESFLESIEEDEADELEEGEDELGDVEEETKKAVERTKAAKAGKAVAEEVLINLEDVPFSSEFERKVLQRAYAAPWKLHDRDVGSVETQIAALSARIILLTEHCAANIHDKPARRGLEAAIEKRKRFLQYVAKRDPIKYSALITRLGIFPVTIRGSVAAQVPELKYATRPNVQTQWEAIPTRQDIQLNVLWKENNMRQRGRKMVKTGLRKTQKAFIREGSLAAAALGTSSNDERQ